MTQALRRERRQKFLAILETYYQDNPPTEDATERNKLVSGLLADASVSRSDIAESIRKFDIAGYFNNNKREYFDIIKKWIPGASFNKIASARDEIIVNLGEALSALMEAEVNTDLRTEYLARGGNINVVKMFDKLCKAFGFDMMNLKPKDEEVYLWIIEREAEGQTVSKFVDWARGVDRAQYIRKYRNDSSHIRNDWALAFTSAKPEFIVSADDIR